MAEKCTDDEESEWLEKALDNLELGGGLEAMEMLDLDVDPDESEDSDGEKDFEDEDDLPEVDDLDENDDEN